MLLYKKIQLTLYWTPYPQVLLNSLFSPRRVCVTFLHFLSRQTYHLELEIILASSFPICVPLTCSSSYHTSYRIGFGTKLREATSSFLIFGEKHSVSYHQGTVLSRYFKWGPEVLFSTLAAKSSDHEWSLNFARCFFSAFYSSVY